MALSYDAGKFKKYIYYVVGNNLFKKTLPEIVIEILKFIELRNKPFVQVADYTFSTNILFPVI